MLLTISIMAATGCIIGWFTNYLAVRLIFRPIKPYKIPLFPMTVQGLIPKRRGEIARSIGKTVGEQLLSIEELLDQLIEGQNKTEVISQIKEKIIGVVKERIPFFIPSGIRDSILKYIRDVFDREAERFVNEMMEEMIHKAAQSINITQMVEDKINGFDLLVFESLLLSIAKNELKHIEMLGGVLGFLIGLLQGILVQFVD